MRKVALVLALAVVAGLLLLSKRGGLGGRAERATTAPAEEAAPEAPSVSVEPKAPAWRAVGDVNAPSGSVEILIEWEDEPDMRIGSGAVVAGRYVVDLPKLAEVPAFLRRRAIVVARASAPGFFSGKSESLFLEDLAPGEIRLDVTLERGAVVRGRVVDETGRAVADADVWLGPNAGAGTTDAEGGFELPIRRAGAFWICARCGDIGVAAVGPLELSPLSSHDASDLVLRGPGRISGIAVYPDGTPVREMQVNAVPVALREAKINHWPDFPFDPSREGVPDGLRWGWTKTDDEGRFLICGLRRGKYFFLEDKSKTICETGTDVRVTIDLYRILVRIVDESGAPAPGVGVSAKSGDDSAAGRIDDLAVGPQELWHIGIGDLGIVPQSVAIQVVPEKREYEARLIARPVTDVGRVEVRLLDPRGEALPEPRVSLYAGVMVLLHERPTDALGRTRLVPTGDYRLIAIPKDPLAPYLPVETTVTVRSGAVTPVTLTARGGGRLRLTLKGGAPGEEIRDGRVTAHPAQGQGVVNFVPLHVRANGGYAIGGDWKWGEPTAGWLLLEPGPHEMRIAVPGYEAAAVPLHVQPEAVTDTEVTLTKTK
jgi:hypothetical protein